MLQLDILRSQEIIFSLDFVDRHHKSLLRSAQVSEHPISLGVAQNVSIPPIAGIFIKEFFLALLICENYFVYVCVELGWGGEGQPRWFCYLFFQDCVQLENVANDTKNKCLGNVTDSRV